VRAFEPDVQPDNRAVAAPEGAHVSQHEPRIASGPTDVPRIERATWEHDRVIVAIGEREPDMAAAVAAPVFGPCDQVVGAIAVSGSATRFTPEVLPAFSGAVRDSAIQLTQRLGGRTALFGRADLTLNPRTDALAGSRSNACS
jgi:hypothetical protein